MKMEGLEKFLNILSKFPIQEKITAVKPLGNGFINDTYTVIIEDTDGKQFPKYVLQRINHEIFTKVDMLQDNIFAVTTHIWSKLKEAGVEDIERKVLTFLHTNDAKKYYFDAEMYWRVSLFIPNSTSYESVTPELAKEAGKAFGNFQYILADLKEGTLGETIEGFHNMELRLQQFRTAVQEDKAGRKTEVQALINELERRAYDMCIQERLFAEGKLVKRTNHCDTKVNNILFDKTTDKVLCVVDLDTVMPGFVLSDIGDFIRTAVNTGKEDDEELDNISVNMPVFEAYTCGYMSEAKAFLTPTEISMLPYGGRLMTYMQTVRFLTDYLNGDVYYKTQKPRHNLIRTRAQFRFLQELEAKSAEMDTFMQQWL